MLATFAMLLILPWLNVAHGTLAEFHPLATALPGAVDLELEHRSARWGSARSAGSNTSRFTPASAATRCARSRARSRLPRRSSRSMFILGTSSVLALVPIEQIDLIAPIPQVLSVGFGALGSAALIAPLTILVAAVHSRGAGERDVRRQYAAAHGGRAGTACCRTGSRRLHPRYQTPVNSIVFVGAVTLAFSIVGLIGVGKQEAFQLLWNASGSSMRLTYLVMFAIPVVGVDSPFWLKAAAVSGFIMTLLFVVLSILPIVQVGSPFVFALKISTVILLANAIGLAIFIGRRKAR